MKTLKNAATVLKASVKKSLYNPRFVAMIKKAVKRNNYTEVDPNNIWGSLKFK